MWSFYDKIYDNIFLNIEKSSLEFVYYKKYVRYYKTIENIKYGGEIDFNFSAEGKKSKFKNFNTIVEKDEACIDDSIKEKIYKLLKMIKKHHHSIENVSLMPSNGNMQFTKQSIGNDRFNVFKYSGLQCANSNEVFPLQYSSIANAITSKRYMNDICYDKEQEKLVSKFYFEKIYNIRDDLGLINSIIESGKKAIDSAERVLEYMDLAYRVLIFVALLFIANYLIYLFVSPSETEVVAQAHQFLLINAFFYIPLVLVNTVRFTIQGMGFSGFAMFAGVAEMIARSLIGLVFVPIFGFSAACFASPLAWILADAFLVPAFIHCLHKLQKAKSSQVTSLY